MQITVGQLLEQKGKAVWTVTPRTTVYEALRLMADKNIGAVPVVDAGRVAGVFSERDYARKIVLKDRSSRETAVRDIMSRDVHHVGPGETIDVCMALMTEQRIRHLPVFESGELVGIVTIGDIVKAIISEQKAEIHELVGYVDSALKERKEGPVESPAAG